MPAPNEGASYAFVTNTDRRPAYMHELEARVDEHGVLVDMNRALKKLLHANAKNLVGQPFVEIVADHHRRLCERWFHAMLKARRSYHICADLRTADDTLYPVRMQFIIDIREDAQPRGFMVLFEPK